MSFDWLRILLIAISGILNAVGFFGLFLVFFPGLVISWLGHLVWVIYVGFNHGHSRLQFGVTIALFVINTLLMLVGSIIDNLLGAQKTRAAGVPWWEIFVSWLGMFIGGIVLTPIGGIGIALALLYLLEFRRLENDREKAWQATKALAFGYGLAAFLRLVMGFVMVALWLVTVIFL
ncbi:MAG: DUF456 domain-containing protein [Anaerolineaceae bacterium]|jgi:uncharacterized protein YqgC (DUF456 family)|nr:DUF456 domain-containing protein [Anaerolineaceae bacterium]MDI9530127.1 DUF456 domain-containing protein [Chloroflexota bacterium]HNZ15890.1 DUF456 domain-containing protein [Anaerolineaceae bacterium]